MKQMHVLLEGNMAGTLTQDASGQLSFSYTKGYSGVPLSLSMSHRNEPYGDKQMRPYLFGLLPDSEDVRKALAVEFEVSARNPFALLRHIGLDCPGAVQICDDEGLSMIKNREEHLVPIDEHQIAERLRSCTKTDSKWVMDAEHWSLGGQQSKLALRKEGGSWYRCEGSAATTHILKPGIQGLEQQALNEFLCLGVAGFCGVNAAKCEYRIFEDQPAIIVTRYDRIRLNGNVLRIHQEDFCQMLGCLPEHKYSEEGGPSAADVIRMLKRTGEEAPDNIRRFVEMLLFNYLLAAPDAHAKNYSVLLGKTQAVLAPLYDAASILPYRSEVTGLHLAMGIAGENRTGHLSRNRIARFVSQNELEPYGLTTDTVADMLMELAEKIPPAMRLFAEQHSDIPGMDSLASGMLPKVESLCELSARRVEG